VASRRPRVAAPWAGIARQAATGWGASRSLYCGWTNPTPNRHDRGSGNRGRAYYPLDGPEADDPGDSRRSCRGRHRRTRPSPRPWWPRFPRSHSPKPRSSIRTLRPSRTKCASKPLVLERNIIFLREFLVRAGQAATICFGVLRVPRGEEIGPTEAGGTDAGFTEISRRTASVISSPSSMNGRRMRSRFRSSRTARSSVTRASELMRTYLISPSREGAGETSRQLWRLQRDRRCP